MRRFALLLGIALSLITTSAVAQNCDGFTDVLASSPFCPDVTWLATYGVTKGCAPSQFCPNENVTRLQMAAFMHRLGENPAFVNGGNAFGFGPTLGTLDNNPLYAIVDSHVAMQLQPALDSYYGMNPNVVLGMEFNGASNGTFGATVSGGGGCSLSGSCPFSSENVVSGNFGTVSGGLGNTAGGGFAATVTGGGGNTAGGDFSTVAGGDGNTAGGHVSFAAGNGAIANQSYSFVWSGWSGGGAPSFNPNEFFIGGEHGLSVDYCSQRPDNGGTCWVYIGDLFGHAIDTYTTAYLSTGGNWTNASDRALKADFTAVDAQAVLAKVAQLPIDEWSYKAEDGQRHLGPVAQDFYAAFALGADDKHISTVDEGGVALVAIKGLYEQLQVKDREIAALREELNAIKAALNLR
jgi:hypothetical protein